MIRIFFDLFEKDGFTKYSKSYELKKYFNINIFLSTLIFTVLQNSNIFHTKT